MTRATNLKAEKNIRRMVPNAEDLIREQMKKSPAHSYTEEDFQTVPKDIVRRYGGDAKSLREMGIDIPANSPSAEDLVRNQMKHGISGSYDEQDLADLPAKIIKRFGGDTQALREMGIQFQPPESVQRFDKNFLDLKKTPGAYQRFSQLLYEEKHPDYENKTLGETLVEISNDKQIFPKLKTEEKQASLDSTISDYEQIAKNKLTNEFPVLLHEIDVQAKNSDRNFNFIPTTPSV